MPGEPVARDRFTTAPPPPRGEPRIRPPSDSPANIVDQNNDDTGGVVASEEIDESMTG